MLDLLYAQAVAARRRWYERHPESRRRLRQPVISIGNLSVGGTGKTPLVAQVAAWLIERGERPAILSRGYGRRERVDGAVAVSDGSRELAIVARAGDEPLMLARQVPRAVVVVAEDRYLAGALAERKLGATVHILDDGFQHVQLARDLDVLVTAPNEIAAGRVLPFGRLREGADAAARAQLVVVVGASSDQARAEAWTLGISQYCAARRRLPPPTAFAAVDAARPVFAFAGIGGPQQFFEGLQAAGWSVAGTRAFADHHWYSADDIRELASAVAASGAASAVTTMKDAVRFDGIDAVPFDWHAVPLALDIDGWDTFAASIDAAIARGREAA